MNQTLKPDMRQAGKPLSPDYHDEQLNQISILSASRSMNGFLPPRDDSGQS
jgi:hypothetical protein